jgi:type IV pilus assembly protein PilA
MKSFLRMKDEGFTLVELMVVVAIIGILSAVAIPNFKKYQAKSKTSEAKLQLSAAYTALQSWYSDYDNYSTCLNLMGYDPSVELAQRFYAVGLAAALAGNPANNASAVTNGAPPSCSSAAAEGTDAVVETSATNTTGYSGGKLVAGVAARVAGDLTATNIGTLIQTTATTFVIGALGNIDSSKTAATTADAWTVNQDKRVIQVRTGY